VLTPAGHVFKLAGPDAPWVLLNWANTFGPLYKLQFMDSFTVVITDPDTIASATHKTGMLTLLQSHLGLDRIITCSLSGCSLVEDGHWTVESPVRSTKAWQDSCGG